MLVIQYKTGTGDLTDPVDIAFGNVVAQSAFDSTFTDESTKSQTFTANGAVINTTTKKYGAGSAFFDGTNDYVDAGSSNPWYDFSTDDFTVEAWVYADPATGGGVDFDRGIWGRMGTGTAFFFLTNDNLTPGIWNGTDAAYATTQVTPNVWQHVAWSRTSGNLKMFIDGVTVFDGAYAGNLGHPLNNMYIGGHFGFSNRYFKGYIDDLRVTRQGGRYIGDFAPPTGPHPTS